ncbi:MAG: hypothetical protein HFG89_03440 [Dorea sp.]|jgi:uncharacterized membrane protein YvbJ|nr:hypothetical protein [Dorea sp.]
MENKEELYSEILKRVQRNYVHMAEIERITKELGSALSSNDRESVHLLLKMRQSEMDLASEVKQEIQLLIRSSTDEKEKLLSWLNGEAKEEPESFEEKKILELSCQLRQVITRTTEIDKALNSRLAGKDSYYQKN